MRRDLPRVVLSVGAVITIVGSLSPWVGSGRVDRSSYEIIDLVDRLGFAEGGPFGVAMRAWPLMPLVVVAGTVAMWWRRHVLGAAVVLAGGGYALVVAVTVRSAPIVAPLRLRIGPALTIVGAAVLLVGTVATLVLAPRPPR